MDTDLYSSILTRRVTLIGVTLAALLNSSASAQTVFTDNFNRPNGAVENGWSEMIDNVYGDLIITDGALATPHVSGIGGIYRLADFSAATRAKATFTQINGFGGLPNRFETAFAFGSNGAVNSGLQVKFMRGDTNYNDSAVILLLDGLQVASVVSSFQFDTSITPTVLVTANGRVRGSVAGSGTNFVFDFGIDYPFIGNSFGLIQAFPDSRSDTIINGTVDDLTLTTGLAASGAVPEPSTWYTMLLGFGLIGAAVRRRSSAALPKP